jgi:hypothetical protein
MTNENGLLYKKLHITKETLENNRSYELDDLVKTTLDEVKADLPCSPATLDMISHELGDWFKKWFGAAPPLSSAESTMQLAEIKKIWNESQGEVDYFGNGDWIEKLDNAINTPSQAPKDAAVSKIAVSPVPQDHAQTGGIRCASVTEQKPLQKML